jgi:hypothetical protein
LSLDDPTLRQSFDSIQAQFKAPHFLWHFDRADAWIVDLEKMDWSIPLQLISDRDPKFLSDFFTALAKALHIKMCTPVAYHP